MAAGTVSVRARPCTASTIPKASSAIVAIVSAIISDEVAPGDGALRTCTTPGRRSSTKSSTRLPSGGERLRTDAGGACDDVAGGSSSGSSLRADATNSRLL